MIDWDKIVLAPLHGIFGEPIIYTPTEGEPFTAQGVFDEAYVPLQAGFEITSALPALGVRLAEFPVYPRQGDTYSVTRLDRRYVVREVQPDSHGEAKLLSNLLNP